MISNTVEQYLNLLSLSNELPDWVSRDKKTHFNLNAFGFDFKKIPHVYSLDMFEDQAEFITAAITSTFKNKEKFTIVAHSIGCLTALSIEEKITRNAILENIVCLGSPLVESPMKLNSGMQKIIDQVQNADPTPSKKFIFQTGEKDF
mgnify:CR=1 FL=1